jgi:hypothetical protein
MRNALSWGVKPCGFVRSDVSEERVASISRVTRIGEIGATLAATIHRNMAFVYL